MGADSGQPPPLPAAVRDEMLLLYLKLLQRLGRVAVDASSSTSGVAAAAEAAVREALSQQLLSLCRELDQEIQGSQGCPAEGQQSTSGAAGTPAAAPAAEVPAVWQQQAGALCKAFEGYVRASSSSSPMTPSASEQFQDIADLCGLDEQ